LAGALSLSQTVSAVHVFFHQQLNARSTILLPDESGELVISGHHETPASHHASLSSTERSTARAVYETGTLMDARELGTDDGERLLLPLVGATRRRGVLIVAASERTPQTLIANSSMLRAVASLLTTAIERLHYVDVANETELEIQSERLRSSILAALSHDIRTPLTALYGLADTLVADTQIESTQVKETAGTIRDQSLQLNSMVTNLLDMARLQAGRITLRREWQPLDEVIGASVRFATASCSQRNVVVEVPPNLPLVNIDAVLIERVLCNLLENASKYSEPGSGIRLVAQASATEIEVAVRNDGSGFPPDRLERIFLLFERGAQDGHVSGMGVGLAICRAVVQAHGGHISASNPPEGGACVTFTLPRGTPPPIDLETDAAYVSVRP
jgi:two-component system sensor histidine kinase KdpD